MHAVGIKPVVVHGGGPQISALMERLGKKPEFRNGLRVTDQETIEIASMVLLGTVNPQLVSAINAHGARAVGRNYKAKPGVIPSLGRWSRAQLRLNQPAELGPSPPA